MEVVRYSCDVFPWRVKIAKISSLPSTTSPFSIISRSFSSNNRRFDHLREILDSDITHFQRILGAQNVLTDTADVAPFQLEWTRTWPGAGTIVLLPRTVDHVSQVLRYCHEHRLGIVPLGGQTGLVGGGVVMSNDCPQEVILSLTGLNRIEAIQNGTVHCQAGCILQTVQEECREQGWLLPLDLGAKGSCVIGGNLATNAGGPYYYRYGSLAGNLLGLQVVLSNGEVMHLNYHYTEKGGIPRSNLKDNTGYKLQQLFVGSEGTLGVITAVALLCRPQPVSVQAAWLVCESFEHVLEVLRTAHACLGEILAALEWMDSQTVDCVSEHLGTGNSELVSIDDGYNAKKRHYLLVETHGSNGEHDQAKLYDFVERLYEQGLLTSGVMAQDETQRSEFWRLRGAIGYTYKYDVSMNVVDFEEFTEDVKGVLQDDPIIVTNWGHVLDGNLHFNVTRPGLRERDEALANRLDTIIFEAVLERGGSISAEHGLGQAKKKYLPTIHDPATLAVMQSIKQTMDPHGILNSGKVLPASSSFT